MEARALIGVIGDWSSGAGPLYRQLADAISDAIERGDLPPGTRLPAERSLADALPASRGTVVSAFGLLAQSGSVLRRRGSGTTVAGESSTPRPGLAAGVRARQLTGRVLQPGGGIQLGLSVMEDVSALPSAAFDVDRSTVARAGGRHGYAPLGISPLRDRVAELLTARGVPTVVEEVAITLGAQHGIALAAEAVAESGATVAVEDPTYPGAIDVYSRAGLAFAAVRTDGAGPDPASLRRALQRHGGSLVHLAPQCASPTGVVTVSARREEITNALADADAWLVEDAALEFLAPPEQHGYLAADRPERTLVVGSTSKVFWGGLRVGWLRGPRRVIERIGRIRAAHDLGSSIAPQVTALRLLDDLETIAEARREESAARREHLRSRLIAGLPGVSIHESDGGLSLWVSVPDGDALVRSAAKQGLDILPGRVCSVSDEQRDRVRISAWAPLGILDEAAERLALAWAAVGSGD
ncbi:MAG: PLP-dependent aminotransferase family protein [Acidimicrobiales bacterium]|nr:PLP-dependent aminotransferase family protein [Acidimicrobiales bacterium]